MGFSGDYIKTCSIDCLPDELLLYIFKLLPLDTLLICENVCTHWKKLATDATLWKHIIIVYSGKPGQSEISEKNLKVISTHSNYIHCLKLQYINNYSVISSLINQCININSLDLVMCHVEKQFESDILKYPLLKRLNLKNSLLLGSDESQALIIPFQRLKHLNYLALSNFGLNTLNCDGLLSCKNLSYIYIEKIRNLRKDYIIELILTKQEILVALHIYGGESVDDKCLHVLAHCPQLKDLAIIRCENLTDLGLGALSNLKLLKHLQLWNNNNFSENCLLSTLSAFNLIGLHSLSLSRIENISPGIVDIISEYYKNLKFLALYQCPKIIKTDYEKQLDLKFRNINVVLY